MRDLTRGERGTASTRPERQPSDPTDRIARAQGRPHRTPLRGRLIASGIVIILSLSLIIASVGLDGFLNRGIVYGTPAINGGGLSLG